MLTLEDLKKVARHQRSYGENRPGYISHDDKDLKGPSSLRDLTELSGRGVSSLTEEGVPKEKLAKRQSVRISVVIEQDPESGEYRMIKK